MEIRIDFGTYVSVFQVRGGQVIATTLSRDPALPDLEEESNLEELAQALDVALRQARALAAAEPLNVSIN